MKSLVKKIFDKLGYEIKRKHTNNSTVLKSVDSENDLSIERLAEKIGHSIVYYMASTGIGTDKCMENGCLPVLTDFYRPIPDVIELEKRDVWSKVSELRGIIWKPEIYLNNIRELAVYADECFWSNEPTKNPMEFYINNTCFSYGCASILHCMIRKNKPKRIIEVGSGNSSRVIAGAINLNLMENREIDVEYTIIDPYTDLDVSKFPKGTVIIKKPVELMNLTMFNKLSENDILFIDSSHVCKTGSDVNFEILEILPLLNIGVYVHFHDISLPREYSKVYFTNPTFRVFWTEMYLLQAFLSCNTSYEVYAPIAFIQNEFGDDFRALFPKGENAVLWHSGSFWIRRVK